MTRLAMFWSHVIAKTPGFGGDDADKVTLSLGSLRKLVKRAHDDGFAAGIAFETDRLKPETDNPFGDLFGDFLRR